MNVNRRQLLQYFGIGATITPVIGGAPLVEAAAKLLAIPSLSTDVVPFPDGHVPPLGRYADRLKWNPYEAIWLYFWQIENNPSPGINYGIGPLEHILGREPTDAEKAAVAGMMQWFGTNCGHSFIAETLKACGYKISWPDWNNNDVSRLQNANIWPGEPAPSPIRIKHRGREIELRYGSPGEVIVS